MWRNYLMIGARSLAKNRLFTALNLVGLAVGMAACLLIAMWVRNEMTYDQWLPDHERIFIVQSDIKELDQAALEAQQEFEAWKNECGSNVGDG